jgi:hypothetical protein
MNTSFESEAKTNVKITRTRKTLSTPLPALPVPVFAAAVAEACYPDPAGNNE